MEIRAESVQLLERGDSKEFCVESMENENAKSTKFWWKLPTVISCHAASQSKVNESLNVLVWKIIYSTPGFNDSASNLKPKRSEHDSCSDLELVLEIGAEFLRFFGGIE